MAWPSWTKEANIPGETEKDGVLFTLLSTLFKLKVVNYLLLEFSISYF